MRCLLLLLVAIPAAAQPCQQMPISPWDKESEPGVKLACVPPEPGGRVCTRVEVTARGQTWGIAVDRAHTDDVWTFDQGQLLVIGGSRLMIARPADAQPRVIRTDELLTERQRKRLPAAPSEGCYTLRTIARVRYLKRGALRVEVVQHDGAANSNAVVEVDLKTYAVNRPR